MFCGRKREYGYEKRKSRYYSVRAWTKQFRRGIAIFCAVVLFPVFSMAQPARGIAAESEHHSERERGLIVRAVAAECGEASFGVQVGLAWLILRRLESGRYGEDAASVIYTADFLRCTRSGRIAGTIPPDRLDRASAAIEAALRGGDPTTGALYFAEPGNYMMPPVQITYRAGEYIFGKR